ncbi:40S ribosomal protein S8 [Entamoeba marina]
MGITRDSKHKRRATGGKKNNMSKKKKYNMGRQPSNTRLGSLRIHNVRCRYGLTKKRALRLETGNFSWISQSMTHTSRILNVVYNASNNDFVRTNTLVKNAIVEIDPAPFRLWFLKFYGKDIAAKDYYQQLEQVEFKTEKKVVLPKEDAKGEKTLAHQIAEAQVSLMNPTKTMQKKYSNKLNLLKKIKFEDAMLNGFQSGKLLACISSRPGQVGRVDGYILEGKELEFYAKKLQSKKK